MAKGYVYILTNPRIQYVYRENGGEVTISPVKIGMGKDVEKRLGLLNTSLPENFVHHMSLVCPDMKAVENVVHLYLDKYRIKTKGGEKTEFFRCSVEEAKNALKQTAKIMHVKEYHIDKSKLIGRSSCKIKSNSQAARLKLAAKVRPAPPVSRTSRSWRSLSLVKVATKVQRAASVASSRRGDLAILTANGAGPSKISASSSTSRTSRSIGRVQRCETIKMVNERCKFVTDGIAKAVRGKEEGRGVMRFKPFYHALNLI